MAKNNDVVILNLDRPRELRFGLKALKNYQAISGVGFDEIGKGGFSFETIETLMYCGLLSDAFKNKEVLKLEDMEDLLDLLPFDELVNKMMDALESSLGKDPNMKGIVAKKK